LSEDAQRAVSSEQKAEDRSGEQERSVLFDHRDRTDRPKRSFMAVTPAKAGDQ